jgi:hypothetical protein
MRILGGLQSIAFRAEADTVVRQSLELAPPSAAPAIARARIEAAGVLLQTLGPGSVGLECASAWPVPPDCRATPT